MYETFYRLGKEPFRLSPDPEFSFAHRSYARAKAYMQYAFNRAEGFVMVTGRPGTGKTTLIGDLVKSLPRSQVSVATLVTPQLEAEDLLQMVAYAFGVGAPSGAGKAQTLRYLTMMLHREREKGRRALLIIDEAQDLSAEALEELRLLTNLQLNGRPLLQIFLVGQEELKELVHEKSMEQVFQRIVAACHLDPMDEHETREYVRHRLLQAGWRNDPQLSEALYPIIHRFSEGIPRRVNLICGRLLLHGAVERKHALGVADARLVVSELHAERLTTLSPAADAIFQAEDRFEEGEPPSLFRPAPPSPVATAPEAQQEETEETGGGSADEAPQPRPPQREETVTLSQRDPAERTVFPVPDPQDRGLETEEAGGHSWLWWLFLLAVLMAGVVWVWQRGLLG